MPLFTLPESRTLTTMNHSPDPFIRKPLPLWAYPLWLLCLPLFAAAFIALFLAVVLHIAATGETPKRANF